MSIACKAVIIVGLPFSEVEGACELVESGKLNRFAPHPDALDADCLVGLQVQATPDCDFKEVPYAHDSTHVLSLFIDFDEATGKAAGKKAKIYLTPNFS